MSPHQAEANGSNPVAAPRPVSEIVSAILEESAGERIPLSDITSQMKGRAHGLLLFVLALPETIPMIGLSAILAVPIFVIGAHLVVRGSDATLPRWIVRRSIRRSHLESAFGKARPVLRRLERVSRPRLHRLARASRLQGTVCLLMAVVLAIPFPGINILAAFGVAGIGLGMLQGDGILVAAACASSLLALAGMVAVVSGIVALAG
jgi:hypothetical protein